MRRLLDGLFTAVALVFIIPTFLVLISWNALPGESLYPLKTSLENITLIMLSGTPLVPKASMKFTDSRFNEATLLLNKKGSSVGYSLLVAQAQTTQNYLATKKDTVDSTTFVQNINTYQAQIEQTKKQVVAQAQASGTLPQNYVIPTPLPTLAPTPVPIIPTAVPVSPEVTAPPSGQQITVAQTQTIVVQQETPQQILQNLNSAESQLQNIKQEVQKQSGQDHGQGQGNQNQQDQSQQGQGQGMGQPQGQDQKQGH